MCVSACVMKFRTQLCEELRIVLQKVWVLYESVTWGKEAEAEWKFCEKYKWKRTA